MLYECCVLEEHRVRLENEVQEHKSVVRDLQVRLEKHQRDQTDYSGRLKYSSTTMSSQDVENVKRRLEAADAAADDLAKQIRRTQDLSSGSEWMLNEIRAEMDNNFLALKKRFGNLVGKPYTPAAGESAPTPPTAPLEDDEQPPASARSTNSESASEAAKVKKLSAAQPLSSFRDGVTKILELLSEISNLRLFVFDALADDVPHYSSWEQRTQTQIFTAKEKVERTQRYICNVINQISSTWPSLAEDKAHWAMLIEMVDDAIRRLVLRNVKFALEQYLRAFQGKSHRELFAVNLKLGANCRLAFVPLATEISQLIMGVINKVTSIGSDRYVGDMTSMPAPAPKKETFIKSHIEYCESDQDVKSSVNAIRAATTGFSDDIVAFVVATEAKFEHLWTPDMTALPAPQLKESLKQLEYWNPKASLKNAILLNAFPLQDAVLSMVQTQLQRLRKKASDDAVSEEAVKRAMQPSTLKNAMSSFFPTQVPPLKTTQMPSTNTTKAAANTTDAENRAVPTNGSARSGPVGSARRGSESENRPPSSGKSQGSTSAESAQKSTPRLTPRQLNTSDSNNSRPTKISSPPATSTMQVPAQNTPRDSPRPSTTPVGTRRASSASTTQGQSLTPQKYNGASTLRSEGSVYVKALGIAQQQQSHQNQPNPSSSSPTVAGSTRSVEVPRRSMGTSNDYQRTSGNSSSSLPEVQGVSSSQKRSAWGTPTKNPEQDPQERSGNSPNSNSNPGSNLPSPSRQAGPYTMARRGSGNTSHDEEDDSMSRMLRKEQESLERLRKLKEREEQRAAQARLQAQQEDEQQSAKLRFAEEKARRDREEREKAARVAKEKREREEKEREELEKERQRQEREQRQRDAEEREREKRMQSSLAQARKDAEREKAREVANRDLEAKLEAEMRRRDEAERRENDLRAMREEEARLEFERKKLQELERERQLEEERQREEMERHQKRIAKLNEETSALRKKLQLPPVQPLSNRAPAEPDSPSPTRGRPQPQTNQPLQDIRPKPGSAQGFTPGAPPYTIPTTRPSSQGLAIPPLPFEDDGVERSLLDEYKRCCAAANIKPNSGLLKKLPQTIGEHVSEINLDLNYIGIKGVQPLIHILRRNRGLRLLNLKDNNLENNEVRQLVAVLLTEAGAELTTLDLSNNPISLAGGSALMDLVTTQKTLVNISIRGTLIQPKVVERIVEAAKENARRQQ